MIIKENVQFLLENAIFVEKLHMYLLENIKKLVEFTLSNVRLFFFPSFLRVIIVLKRAY